MIPERLSNWCDSFPYIVLFIISKNDVNFQPKSFTGQGISIFVGKFILGSCQRDMTVCFIFLLSFNISLQNETDGFIKPAFANAISAGVLVVRE